MDIKAVRIAALQGHVDRLDGGNVSAFARRVGRQQSFVSEVLKGKRSFSEKLARALELKLGLERNALDSPAGEPGSPKRALRVAEGVAAWGLELSREAAEVGSEWMKIEDESIRKAILVLIETVGSQQVLKKRAARAPAKKPRHKDAPYATT